MSRPLLVHSPAEVESARGELPVKPQGHLKSIRLDVAVAAVVAAVVLGNPVSGLMLAGAGLGMTN